MIYTSIKKEIESYGFDIESFDFERPWGGFLVINKKQVQKFLNKFFIGFDLDIEKTGGKWSLKVLIIKPNVRLSWQYHNRRAELWQVYKGSPGVIKSNTDTENEMEVFFEGDYIVLDPGERHRLIGLDDYSVVAEVWEHTDKKYPSDEEDIIRVQDDFGR